MKTEKYVEVINAHLLIFIGCASREAKCQKRQKKMASRGGGGNDRMAKQAKALTAKHDDINLIPRAHMVEGESGLSGVVL